MNEEILAYINSLPLGGGYTWDKNNPTTGVQHDLVYKGSTILAKDVNGSTYCCGITFQIWFESVGKYLDISVNDMRQIQRYWYVAVPNYTRGCLDALVQFGLGEEVKWSQVLPGDFLQLWRKSGSGHSVVIMGKELNGVEYFSTQRSTNGIGKYIEYWSTAVHNPIVKLHIVRANTSI